MTTAFQANAFNHLAFQIAAGDVIAIDDHTDTTSFEERARLLRKRRKLKAAMLPPKEFTAPPSDSSASEWAKLGLVGGGPPQPPQLSVAELWTWIDPSNNPAEAFLLNFCEWAAGEIEVAPPVAPTKKLEAKVQAIAKEENPEERAELVSSFLRALAVDTPIKVNISSSETGPAARQVEMKLAERGLVAVDDMSPERAAMLEDFFAHMANDPNPAPPAQKSMPRDIGSAPVKAPPDDEVAMSFLQQFIDDDETEKKKGKKR